MSTTITTRKRGIFGWFWLLLFLVFQAVMIYLTVINIGLVGEVASECGNGEYSSACEAGAAIGGGLVALTGWFAWMLGTVILGAAVLMTRGKLITQTVKD